VFYDDEKDRENEKSLFREIDYFRNRTRGCAYRFGFHATEEFLAANNLVGLVRAHEVQKEGFRFHFTAIQQKDRLWDHVVVTVFSAPNYW
jgi:serine/threonine-protein phosphatase 2B catalytic subunit